MKHISDIIEGKPLTHASASDSVRSVARKMAEKNIGAVAVMDQDKLVGMFTERDLMSRVVARDLNPDNTEVSSVMTREIGTASPDELLEDAAQKMMKLNCRHLPVMREGTLVGMISLRDVLRFDAQEAHEKAKLLGELVTEKPSYDS